MSRAPSPTREGWEILFRTVFGGDWREPSPTSTKRKRTDGNRSLWSESISLVVKEIPEILRISGISMSGYMGFSYSVL